MAKTVDELKKISDTDQSNLTDNMLESFAFLAHDIESPIASTKYLLKLIEENRFDPDKELHQRLVKSSKVAIERAESIIFDIMAIVKGNSKGFETKLIDLVPDSIINEAIELVTNSAIENGITITYKNNGGHSIVSADPMLLKRMLDNLLYNAVRHTPSDGKISVYIEPQVESVFIHIKDDGPGLGDIEPEVLFEKYGQLKYRTDGKHRGVGMGLYFCMLAAKEMNGTVIADDHPDGGAVFSIKLNKGAG